jgi:hypothetical protein
MPKAALAERILEMVTRPQRSASIVGDLLEEASNRSALWFWLSLLRIFVSHLFQDLRAHRLRMMWLGFSEFLIFVIVVVFVMGEFIEVKSYFRPYREIVHYGLPILLGWHIARRSRGCELASGVSLISVILIFRAVLVLPLFWTYRMMPPDLQVDPYTVFMHTIYGTIPFCVLIILGSFICRFRMSACRRKLLLS